MEYEQKKSFAAYIVYTLIGLSVTTSFVTTLNTINDLSLRVTRLEERMPDISDRYTGTDASRDQRLVDIRFQNIERRIEELQKSR